MIFVVLALLGLCAGSFISALVWRVRQQERLAVSSSRLAKTIKRGLPTANSQQATAQDHSILKGRSQCPYCRHTLAWYDLIPLLSWVILRGRCRYCSQSISWQYPAIELSAAAVFVISYSYWPGGVYGVGDWVLLTTWLATSVGLLALFVYDLRWMMLPNRIIYPTLVVAVAGRLIYLVSLETDIDSAIANWALSVLVASGFFWLIYMASSGKWIGYGDVRLGLITGTILADPLLSLLMIFVASVLGSLVAVPALATGRKHIGSRLPFGPYLIAATFLVLIFGQTVTDSYKRLLE